MDVNEFPFWKRYALAIGIALVEVTTYLLVGRASAGRSVDLMTDLDRRIPFLGWTVWLYLPLFVVLFHFAVWSIKTWEVFWRAAASLFLATAVSALFFWYMPSAYPRPPVVDDGTLTGQLLLLLRAIDPPNNTFPSLHVAFSLSVALAAYRSSRKLGTIALVMSLGPVLSILTTKQHYVLDLIGGLVVALVIHGALFRRWIFAAAPQPQREPEPVTAGRHLEA